VEGEKQCLAQQISVETMVGGMTAIVLQHEIPWFEY
jgi:hypothetical protein